MEVEKVWERRRVEKKGWVTRYLPVGKERWKCRVSIKGSWVLLPGVVEVPWNHEIGNVAMEIGRMFEASLIACRMEATAKAQL